MVSNPLTEVSNPMELSNPMVPQAMALDQGGTLNREATPLSSMEATLVMPCWAALPGVLP